MALNGVNELGLVINNLSSSQDTIQQNVSPDEADALFNRAEKEQIVVKGTVRMLKRPYRTDAFILGHPVQGDLDNGLYILDKGYAVESAGFFSLPVSMPVTFAGGTTATEVIFETEF